MATGNRDLFVEKIESELERWPGVAVQILNKGGGRHPRRAVFSIGDQSRFIPLPSSHSDWRAPLNLVRDMRKHLRALGASEATEGDNMIAKLAINKTAIILSIPRKSPLFDRFADKAGHSKGYWRLEMRAPSAPGGLPFLAAIPVPSPPAGARHDGIISGYYSPMAKALMLSVSRKVAPRIAKLGEFGATHLTHHREDGDALLFEIPSIRKEKGKPRGRAAAAAALKAGAALAKEERERERPGIAPGAPPEAERAPALARGPEPVEDAPAPAPDVVRVPVAGTINADGPMILQLPKEPISIERAVAVLNAHKKRLGYKLKFSVTEGGFLSATAKLGEGH